MTTTPRARPDLLHDVRRRVGLLAPALLDLSHDLHSRPELAWAERRSSRRLASYLSRAGLEVAHPAHGLPTSFRARAGLYGPLVVLCREYDALPGLGHGCGHNVVAAAAAGAAAVLAPLAQRHGGRVVALGTPAEGGGGGNALNAAVLTHQALAAARSGLGAGGQVTSVIVRGGSAANVVPERAEVQVMVRAATTTGLPRLGDLVQRCSRAGALANGCSVGIEPTGPLYRDLRTDPRLARSLERHLRAVGRPPRPYDSLDVLTAGSTDLGNVSHVVPVAHPKLSVGHVAPHSREFAAAAVSPAGDRAVLDGATLLALAALDVWASPPTEGPLP